MDDGSLQRWDERGGDGSRKVAVLALTRLSAASLQPPLPKANRRYVQPLTPNVPRKEGRRLEAELNDQLPSPKGATVPFTHGQAVCHWQS